MEKTNNPCYVFNTHAEAEEAIQLLSRSGVDVKTLSLVGKGYHSEEHPIGFYTAGDRIRSWGGTGAFWGGIWGLLLAPAVFCTAWLRSGCDGRAVRCCSGGGSGRRCGGGRRICIGGRPGSSWGAQRSGDQIRDSHQNGQVCADGAWRHRANAKSAGHSAKLQSLGGILSGSQPTEHAL
jgi:hypothetical protein